MASLHLLDSTQGRAGNEGRWVMGDDIQHMDLNGWRWDQLVNILNQQNALITGLPIPYTSLMAKTVPEYHIALLKRSENKKAVICCTTCTCHLWGHQSVNPCYSALPQCWTQRARRHHLDQRPEDLISEWCQCCHQAGGNFESSCAPWKWRRYTHSCSHGDWPLTLHKSHHRSWS